MKRQFRCPLGDAFILHQAERQLVRKKAHSFKSQPQLSGRRAARLVFRNAHHDVEVDFECCLTPIGAGS